MGASLRKIGPSEAVRAAALPAAAEKSPMGGGFIGLRLSGHRRFWFQMIKDIMFAIAADENFVGFHEQPVEPVLA